ncbi:MULTISPECIES: hypothetical protein [Olsenella]|uniref:hypothetical protein n=1 Tax=Olsenella TaxID=133925 RepID=UPI0008A27FA6|nr:MULTISPECIES: hypothetical protein [Olsenella]OFK24116.1 hypothetical protein HMPREF2826_08290 [Olsenella sp. HMSC062G07]
MSDMPDAGPLSDEERAELQRLRAERARRLDAERARKERLELQQLKEERAEAAKDERIRELRRRNARLMEPDDELNMPLGQKVVLGAILIVALALLLMMLLNH